MNRGGRIAYTIGFLASVTGYSFRSYLWDGAFYHMIAIAFVGITYSVHAMSNKNWCKNATFFVFACCVNNLVDEIQGVGTVFSWSEYIISFIVLVYLFRKKCVNLLKKLVQLKTT